MAANELTPVLQRNSLKAASLPKLGALLGTEALVKVGVVAADDANTVVHLILRGELKQRYGLPHGVYGFTPFYFVLQSLSRTEFEGNRCKGRELAKPWGKGRAESLGQAGLGGAK